MDTHQVEPVLFLSARLEKLDFSIPESSKQSLISDIAHAIKSKFGLSFLKENRFYYYVIGLRSPSVVVDKSRYL